MRILMAAFVTTMLVPVAALAQERVAPPPPMMMDAPAQQNMDRVLAPAGDLPQIEAIPVQEILTEPVVPDAPKKVKKSADGKKQKASMAGRADNETAVTLDQLLGVGGAQGELMSLEDALLLAYRTNPNLGAARAAVKSTYEQLPQALSGWLPRLDATAGVDYKRASPDPGSTADGTEKTAGVTLTQPLYRGGKTSASIRAARALIDAQLATLATTERQVLYRTGAAYMDVLRAEAALKVNEKNRAVIARQLTATRDRFQAGDLTRTDVAQAEFRLAAAEADVTAAKGDAQSARAVFEQLVGTAPQKLSLPNFDFAFPKDKDDAVHFAEIYNPDVIAAQARQLAAKENVDVVFADMLPEVSINAGANMLRGAASNVYDELDSSSVGVALKMPLYQGGATRSRVRAAKYTANELQLKVLDAVRTARAETVRAWEDLIAAQSEMTSRLAQVRAAEIARTGVRREADVGERTILDALDADLEVRDAQISLITAKRNEVVARFALASAMGLLVPGNVGIDQVAFDFDAYARGAPLRIFTNGIEAEGVDTP